MGRRVVLDTNLLIAIERGMLSFAAFGDDEISIAAVSVAEFSLGIYHRAPEALARRREQWLDTVTAAVPVLAYTSRTAMYHARLMAHARRQGKPRGAHELIIAAHAAETGRILVSADENAHFADLPGVSTSLPPSGAE